MLEVKVERRYITTYRCVMWSTVVRCGRFGQRIEIWPAYSKAAAVKFAEDIRALFPPKASAELIEVDPQRIFKLLEIRKVIGPRRGLR